MIPHTEYILETLWAISREHGEACESMSDVSDAVAYCFNTVVAINKQTLYLAKSEEEVRAARASGKSVRVGPTDTNKKREMHVRLLVEELESLGAFEAPSREHYRQQLKELCSVQKTRAVAAGNLKRKPVTEEQDADLLGGVGILYVNEEAFVLSEGLEVGSLAGAGRVMHAPWWKDKAKVSDDDIAEDIRSSLVHC